MLSMRFTLDPKTQQVLSERIGKKYSMQTKTKHQLKQLLILDKIYFKSRTITRDK